MVAKRRREMRSTEYYSGRMYERDVLGPCQATEEGFEVFKKIAEERDYVSYEESMELIRCYSAPDPTNPEKPFAKELRLAIIESLGITDDSVADRVKFYSSVGTPFDKLHGVDGWVEFDPGEEEEPIVVTMDVTLDRTKDEHKADVIVRSVPDPSENEDQFLALVYAYYGPKFAEKLKTAVQLFQKEKGTDRSAA